MSGITCRPEAVPVPTRGDRIYKDDGAPGLYLRVTSAGSRSWYLYKRFQGRLLKLKLGDALRMPISEARMKALDLVRTLEQGENPYARLRTWALWDLRLAELWEQYFREHVMLHDSRPEEAQRGYSLYWGSLRDMRAGRLRTADLQAWMNRLGREVGHATANKQFARLRACLRWCEQKELVRFDRDPTVGVTKFPEQRSERFVRPGEEFERLKSALHRYPGDVADAIWLLLWTGARKSNVLAMEWSELDLSSGRWQIPARKTKPGRTYQLVLAEAALEVLRRRQHLRESSPWVFPSRDSESGHLENIDRTWNRIRRAAGLGDVRLHDLRHTHASWLALANVSAFTIQRALQHRSVSTTQQYTHLQDDHVRQALEEVQRKVGHSA